MEEEEQLETPETYGDLEYLWHDVAPPAEPENRNGRVKKRLKLVMTILACSISILFGLLMGIVILSRF